MAETIGLRAIIDLSQFNRGISGYNRGIDQMNRRTSSFTSTATSQLGNLGGSLLSFGAIAGGAALAGVAALAAGLVAFGASAVREGAAYTRTMSNVKAVTGATEEQFASLQTTAEELGRTTKFTSIEAAEGMGFLAMAGFEVNEVISAMPGVLDLAAAGNLQLGQSADIVSNILTGFGEEADQTGRFVDVLTATFTSSNTSLEQLGQAMKFVAPIAAELGLSVEDASAAIGVMGDAGIQASMAGTSLRTILLRLSAPTGQAASLIKELGLEVFDAEGSMLPFSEVVGNVGNALEGMSQQQRQATLNTLFGKRAISSFNILLNKGEEDLEAFGDELRGSMGTASEIASTQLDNLSGDVTLFQSALSGVRIDVFRALEPVLRAIVSQGLELLTVFGPQLTSIFEAIPLVINDIISVASELFATFQRGGIAGLSESLGITPDIIELIDRIAASATTLGQAILSFLLPGLQGLSGGGLLDIINSAITFLNENFELLQGAILGIGAVLAAGVFVALAAALLTLLSPINLIIVGAALLGAAWAGNWGNIQGITMSVITTLTDLFNTAFPIIQAVVLTAGAIISSVFAGIMSVIMGQVVPNLQAAFENLTVAINSLGLNWSDIFNAILTATGIVAAAIGAIFLALVATVVGVIAGLSSVTLVFSQGIQNVATFIQQALSGVEQFVIGFVQFWTSVFAGDLPGAVEAFLLGMSGVSDILSGIFGTLVTIVTTPLVAILTFVGTFVTSIIDFFTTLSSTLIGNSIIPDMIMAIIESFTNMVAPILAIFSTLSEGIGTILGAIFGGGDGEAAAPTVAFDPAEALAGLEEVTLATENWNLLLTNITIITIPLLLETFTILTTLMIEQLLLVLNTAILPVDMALIFIYSVTLPTLQAVSIATTEIMIAGFLAVNAVLLVVIATLNQLVGVLNQIPPILDQIAASATVAADEMQNLADTDLSDLISDLNSAESAVNSLTTALQNAVSATAGLSSGLATSGIGTGASSGLGLQAGTPSNTGNLLGLGFRIPPGFPNDTFGPLFVESGEEMLVTPRGMTIEGLIFSRLADLLRGPSVQGGSITNNITNIEMNMNLQTTSSAQANVQQFEIQRGLVGV